MITEIIKAIQKTGKLEPDLMKSENGNNFRAISEAKILEVISPILEVNDIFYTTHVKESHLEIREAYGKNGKKLIYCAWLVLELNFYYQEYAKCIAVTESVGMGIDDNDKAMGKAYTYALKYALLKFFRLRFGDDPDFKASEPIPLEKPKSEEAKEAHAEKKEKEATKKAAKSDKNQNMTEKQRDYILGMMKTKGIREATIIGKFKVEPSFDEVIPMTTARAIIKWLEEQDDLPF